MTPRRTLGAVFAAVCALSTSFGSVAQAAGADADDSNSAPNTRQEISASNVIVAGTVDGAAYSFDCFLDDKGMTNTTLTFSFSAGESLGCIDNVHGGKLMTSTLFGLWSFTEVDIAHDEGAVEPGRDSAHLNIPQAGWTLSGFVGAPSCTITFAPNGPAKIGGQYNESASTPYLEFKKPISASPSAGCTSSSTFELDALQGAHLSVYPGFYDAG